VNTVCYQKFKVSLLAESLLAKWSRDEAGGSRSWWKHSTSSGLSCLVPTMDEANVGWSVVRGSSVATALTLVRGTVSPRAINHRPSPSLALDTGARGRCSEPTVDLMMSKLSDHQTTESGVARGEREMTGRAVTNRYPQAMSQNVVLE
jgi:hypothetical protein